MGERIHIRRAHAVAWVKKNKVTKADKSEEDYIKRVKTIMEGGASSRSRLRSLLQLIPFIYQTRLTPD